MIQLCAASATCHVVPLGQGRSTPILCTASAAEHRTIVSVPEMVHHRCPILIYVFCSGYFHSLGVGLQEDSFLGLLEAAGFAVQQVPQAQLAPEYQTGSYRVLRACRID